MKWKYKLRFANSVLGLITSLIYLKIAKRMIEDRKR